MRAKRSKRTVKSALSCSRTPACCSSSLSPLTARLRSAKVMVVLAITAFVGVFTGTISHLYSAVGSDNGLAAAQALVGRLAASQTEIREATPLRFSHLQSIATQGARDTDTFVSEGVTYLVVSNTEDNAGHVASPTVMRWDADVSQFLLQQVVPVPGSYDSAPFVIDGVQYVAFASTVRQR
jgi:hypothetical protein